MWGDEDIYDDEPRGVCCPYRARMIVLAALAGLAPVAVFAAVMWWGMG